MLLTGLVVHLVLLHGWRRTPEEHLAAEVVEIGVHGEWDLQGVLGLDDLTHPRSSFNAAEKGQIEK